MINRNNESHKLHIFSKLNKLHIIDLFQHMPAHEQKSAAAAQGGTYILYWCSAQLISFQIDCFYVLWNTSSNYRTGYGCTAMEAHIFLSGSELK